jgi:hypothetical protein
MAGQIGRDDFAFDLARAETDRDLGLGGRGPGENQLRAAGVLQDGNGPPRGRAELAELIVERGGQGGASVDAEFHQFEVEKRWDVVRGSALADDERVSPSCLG